MAGAPFLAELACGSLPCISVLQIIGKSYFPCKKNLGVDSNGVKNEKIRIILSFSFDECILHCLRIYFCRQNSLF